MGLILSVRPAGDGVIVAVSGAVDVCTEGPLQQVLLRIMREPSARIFLDLSGCPS
jgi:anti-anti-sigma regulatory factor